MDALNPCLKYITLLVILLFVLTNAVSAEEDEQPTDPPPPSAIASPPLTPPPIPHSATVENEQVYNHLLGVEDLPIPSIEADIFDDGSKQESPGRGVHQVETGEGQGTTLYTSSSVCNDFNDEEHWAAADSAQQADLWTNWYAGWAPYAVDDGGFFQARNVHFEQESVVGPGSKYGDNQYSAKIASTQPFAAGFGSPRISVPAGAEVVVSVNYLIWDHDFKGLDYDWVSMGLKADAGEPGASYANGYRRGEWSELSYTVTAGDSGSVMVLLQAHSPAALNSNIYFDDVQIRVNGEYLSDCLYETASPR